MGPGSARFPVTRRLALVVAAVLAAVVLPAEAGNAAPFGVPGVRADDGAYVVSETLVGPRMVDIVVASPALGASASVRLLLPPSWFTSPARTFPVLHLLHGCCEPYDYQSWTQFTDVEGFTADKDVLVVMPTDGGAGLYTDWWNDGRRGTPGYETFHTVELLQIIERGYRAGPKHAVAGLSIGGLGAMYYAARHPGVFGAAASYSGLLNTQASGVPLLVQGILLRVGADPSGPWGDPLFNFWIWDQHNPFDFAPRLRGTLLYISAGTGLPGPLDPPNHLPDVLEKAAGRVSLGFADRLRHLGIPAVTHFYGSGTHSWSYWDRELKASWPVLAAGMGLTPPIAGTTGVG